MLKIFIQNFNEVDYRFLMESKTLQTEYKQNSSSTRSVVLSVVLEEHVCGFQRLS